MLTHHCKHIHNSNLYICKSPRVQLGVFFFYFTCFSRLASFNLHCTIHNKKCAITLERSECRGTDRCYRQLLFFFFNKNILQYWSQDMTLACLIHSVLLLKILLSNRPQTWPANVHMLQVFYTVHYLHGSWTHKLSYFVLSSLSWPWMAPILQRESKEPQQRTERESIEDSQLRLR